MDRLEGRNPVIECLQRKKRRMKRILLDRGAKPDERIQRMLALAGAQGVPVERVDRHVLDKMAEDRVHNGVIGEADELESYTAKGLLDHLFNQGLDAFVILVDEIAYEHNLGAILRSSLGFGVGGVVVPTRRGAGATAVVQRVSMGACEEIPIVREGLHSALRHVRDAGIRTIGAEVGGTPFGEVDLRGPLALVLGGEGEGLSPKLRDRCDQLVSIPLRGGLESLNVSVAAALFMYEKRRQDGWFAQAR